MRNPIEVVAAEYPARLRERLGDDAPAQLSALGNLELLRLPTIALFCSVRCPGNAILTAYDQAARWRDAGRCVIGGFHSPVEKECLRILLRGKQPIVICAARAINKIRLPSEWRVALEAGRLLIISPFEKRLRRPTLESARRRNEVVAALADEVLIVHATPGGNIERISKLIDGWHVQRRPSQTP
jgi:predicted Rossmann fold nucleotide-binding protein DprA/Smf involved in DNA uptake